MQDYTNNNIQNQESKQSISHNDTLKHTSLKVFLVGIILVVCITLTYFITNMSYQVPLLQYVSQKELFELEKARIKGTGEEDLFFGKIKEAVNFAEKEIRSRNSSAPKAYSRVLLVTDQILDPDVKSITEEVHSLIIEHLSSNSKEED